MLSYVFPIYKPQLAATPTPSARQIINQNS